MSYQGPTGELGMDDSRIGTVTSNVELSDVLDTQGKSALELATSSRHVRGRDGCDRPFVCVCIWLVSLLCFIKSGLVRAPQGIPRRSVTRPQRFICGLFPMFFRPSSLHVVASSSYSHARKMAHQMQGKHAARGKIGRYCDGGRLFSDFERHCPANGTKVSY